MSGIELFQFEPVYQPGEEPPQEESVEQEVEAHEEDTTSRMGNTEWCLCGACALMPVANECYCCQELEELNQKFVNSGVRCITEHPKFGIVCLDTDILTTALVAIHNARLNPIPDPIVNRTLRLAAYRQFNWWAHRV